MAVQAVTFALTLYLNSCTQETSPSYKDWHGTVIVIEH